MIVIRVYTEVDSPHGTRTEPELDGLVWMVCQEMSSCIKNNGYTFQLLMKLTFCPKKSMTAI